MAGGQNPNGMKPGQMNMDMVRQMQNQQMAPYRPMAGGMGRGTSQMPPTAQPGPSASYSPDQSNPLPQPLVNGQQANGTYLGSYGPMTPEALQDMQANHPTLYNMRVNYLNAMAKKQGGNGQGGLLGG